MAQQDQQQTPAGTAPAPVSRFTDHELEAVLRSGAVDVVDQLNDVEMRRLEQLGKRLLGEGAGTGAQSEQRAARLKEGYPTKSPPKEKPGADEPQFQKWYKGWAQKLGLDTNPDAPEHNYDYRAAFHAGVQPDAEGHWPSTFKGEGHQNLVVEGKDTRTGRTFADQPTTSTAGPFGDLMSQIDETNKGLGGSAWTYPLATGIVRAKQNVNFAATVSHWPSEAVIHGLPWLRDLTFDRIDYRPPVKKSGADVLFDPEAVAADKKTIDAEGWLAKMGFGSSGNQKVEEARTRNFLRDQARQRVGADKIVTSAANAAGKLAEAGAFVAKMLIPGTTESGLAGQFVVDMAKGYVKNVESFVATPDVMVKEDPLNFFQVAADVATLGGVAAERMGARAVAEAVTGKAAKLAALPEELRGVVGAGQAPVTATGGAAAARKFGTSEALQVAVGRMVPGEAKGVVEGAVVFHPDRLVKSGAGVVKGKFNPFARVEAIMEDLARRAESKPLVVQPALVKTMAQTEERSYQAARDLRAAGNQPAAELAERVATKAQEIRDEIAGRQAPEAEAQLANVTPEPQVESPLYGATSLDPKLDPQGGYARKELIARLAASQLGGAIGAAMSVDDDHPLSMYVGAGMGMVAGFAFGHPEMFSGPGRANFETAFRGIVAKLPDRPLPLPTINPTIHNLAAGIMGVAGAVTMGGGVDDDFDWLGAAVGAVAGFGLTRAGLRFNARGWFNPKRAYQKMFEELGHFPDEMRPKVRAIRDSYEGKIREQQDAWQSLGGSTKDERIAITDYLDGKASWQAVAPKYREAAATVRHLWDDMTLDLIKVGAVDKTLVPTLLNNLGTYIPRLYLQFEQEDAFLAATRWLQEHGEPLSRLSDRNYLKGRQNVPLSVAQAWGEIRDNPAYLLGKRGPIVQADIHTHRLVNEIASMPDMMLDAQIAKGLPPSFYPGPRGTRSKLVEYGGKVYRQMPDNPRYGRIKGQFVEEGIADYFLTMHEVPGLLRQMLDSGTGLFKSSKVVYNPATLIRNALGQMILNDLAGVPMWRVDKYQKAARDYHSGGARYIEARNAGAFSGVWYQEEVKALLDAHTKSSSTLAAVGDWANRIATTPYAGAANFYGATEQYMRMVMYNQARDTLGHSVEESVRFAKRWAFDYSEVPQFIKIARKSVLGPSFISFSFKGLPLVAQSAINLKDPMQMFRFWKYPAAFAAFNEYSAQKTGLQNEKTGVIPTLKRVALGGLGLAIGAKKWLPDYGQRFLPDYAGNQEILMPYVDGYGRRVFKDLTYYMPWGDVGEVGKGNIGKTLAKMGIPFPRQVEPSNPALQVVVAGLTGRDLFTGQPVIPDGSGEIDSTLAMARYMFRNYSPQAFGFQYPQIKAAWKGKVSDRPDQPDLPTAIGKLFGNQDRPVDPQTSLNFEIGKTKDERNKVQARITRLSERGASENVLTKLYVKKGELDQEIKDMMTEKRRQPRSPAALRDARRKVQAEGKRSARSAQRRARAEFAQ